MSGLNEENTKLRYITPALIDAGWDLEHISCEDYFFSDGKILIDGGNGKRAGKGNKTDYQLCHPDLNRLLRSLKRKIIRKRRDMVCSRRLSMP